MHDYMVNLKNIEEMDKVRKYCTVTYTTFDQKEREISWDVTNISERFLNNTIEFVKTGKWPKLSDSKKNWNMHWGLRLSASWSSLDADLFGPGYMWKQPNGSHYTYYRELVQRTIIPKLAMECSLDADFGKALLKQATDAARKRDQEDELFDRAHRDALDRAKQRIRYNQKKYPDDHFDAGQYASVIEEYRLFTVLDIQPPIEK